jgi:solute carrier family 30 (zinc transporter), member 2
LLTFLPVAASYLASLPATLTHTYGLKRTESLAALFSMTSLAFVSVGLAYEAVMRIVAPPTENIDAPLMSGIAAIGVCVNVVLAFVLGEHHVHMPGSSHIGGECHGHDHHGHHHEEAHHHDEEHGGHDEHNCAGGHDHGHDHKHDKEEKKEETGHHHGHDHGHDHKHEKEEKKEETGHHHGHDHGHDHKHEKEEKKDESGLHHGHDHGHGHKHSPKETEDHKTCSGHSHGHDHHAAETDALLGGGHGHHASPEETVVEPKVQKRNVNLHAAYIHVMGDLAQSAAVLIAGVVIWFKPEWQIVDPICTLGFCMIVFLSTLGVLRSSIAVLLEETPANLSWKLVYDAISSVPIVTNVHDLHIWCISHGEPCLSVHCFSSDPNALSEVYKVCKRFGIYHATIQIQDGDGRCTTCKGAGCMSSIESGDE